MGQILQAEVRGRILHIWCIFGSWILCRRSCIYLWVQCFALLYIPVGRVLVGQWFSAGMMSRDTNWRTGSFFFSTSHKWSGYFVKTPFRWLPVDGNQKSPVNPTTVWMYHFFKRKKLVNHGDFTTTNLNTGEFCLAEFLVGNIHRWFVLGVVVFFFRFFPQAPGSQQPTNRSRR